MRLHCHQDAPSSKPDTCGIGSGTTGAVETGDGIVTGVRYRFDTIEAQIRLLADTTFSMRDYETALSMYRLARDDFKSAVTVSGRPLTAVVSMFKCIS